VAEDDYVLALRKLERAVRKTLAKEVESSVFKKIKDLENKLNVSNSQKEKKDGILKEIVRLSRLLIDSQNGKAKARRDAAKDLEEFIDKISPIPEPLKTKNIKEVVGEFKKVRKKK